MQQAEQPDHHIGRPLGAKIGLDSRDLRGRFDVDLRHVAEQRQRRYQTLIEPGDAFLQLQPERLRARRRDAQDGSDRVAKQTVGAGHPQRFATKHDDRCAP